jgi:crotonobetainyl-CoA:carnitine CoA-transferase CaiB-like acyl-CoA transferase
LAGLKVLDLSWVFVGPSSIRPLADYGATVVRVESAQRVDNIRTLSPMKDGQHGPERSAPYHTTNAGKLGLALNLAKPEAREVVKRLAQWADVLAESFTPKAMRAWGLHYDVLRELNPRLIYVSTCLGGQWGPYSHFAGYGTQGASLAGFNIICGWPDRAPAGAAGPYTDYITPPFITSTILAALEERERTGAGQHIDISQMEASIHFLAPALLDYEVNGHILEPDGNRDPAMAPHGVFRCAGDERWVAIAVQDDAQWRVLCEVMHQSDLAADQRYATLAGRKRHEDAIEREIEQWTASRSAEQVQDELIARGIAAHVVSNADDIHNDPQFRHRDHYVTVRHPELGEIIVENSRFRLSRTPAQITRPGPVYGQDADFVLSQILGLSSDEITDLAVAGALE